MVSAPKTDAEKFVDCPAKPGSRAKAGKGQTMGEYALIVGALVVICAAAFSTLGGEISTLVSNVTAAF